MQDKRGRSAQLISQPGKGIILHIPEPLQIILGETTAQDLLLDLGPPLRKFHKEDNRLERMWAATESPEGSCESSRPSYLYFACVGPTG